MKINNTYEEVRNTFINFFVKNNHIILNGSSLIPKNDNSLLFTNSGMNQFKNIILGIENYKYKNVVTVQKCIRAGGKFNDIEQIGYTNYHHTFFEMLGNFSFNDYYKEDAIKFSFDFITSANWLNIPKEKLIITVNSIDYESYNIWKKIGINKNNIIKLGEKNNFLKSDNFWKMGNYGICGLSSEIFYIKDNKNIKYKISKNNFKNKCIEIWNLVFIEYNLKTNKKLEKLPYKSIDTGMGLERISSVLQNKNSIYDTDLFKNIINIILKLTKTYNVNPYIKIISDHIRSIIFITNEKIVPTNEGRGYVLRKIIRRSISSLFMLGIKKELLYKLVKPVINLMNFYKNEFNFKNIENIKNIIFLEETKFIKLINNVLKIFKKKIIKENIKNKIDSKYIFKIYDTYGLPIIIINKFLNKNNIIYNTKKFKNLIKLQKIKSKNNRL